MIMFSPSGSTVMRASPEAVSGIRRTADVSTDSARRAPASRAPKTSSPTQPTIRTRAPSRAAATAWLPPLPPGAKRAAEPRTVAPGPGSRGTVTEMSMFILPSTVTRGAAVIRAPARCSCPVLLPSAAAWLCWGPPARSAGLRHRVARAAGPPGQQHREHGCDRARQHRRTVARHPGHASLVPDAQGHRR